MFNAHNTFPRLAILLYVIGRRKYRSGHVINHWTSDAWMIVLCGRCVDHSLPQSSFSLCCCGLSVQNLSYHDDDCRERRNLFISLSRGRWQKCEYTLSASIANWVTVSYIMIELLYFRTCFIPHHHLLLNISGWWAKASYGNSSGMEGVPRLCSKCATVGQAVLQLLHCGMRLTPIRVCIYICGYYSCHAIYACATTLYTLIFQPLVVSRCISSDNNGFRALLGCHVWFGDP